MKQEFFEKLENYIKYHYFNYNKKHFFNRVSGFGLTTSILNNICHDLIQNNNKTCVIYTPLIIKFDMISHIKNLYENNITYVSDHLIEFNNLSKIEFRISIKNCDNIIDEYGDILFINNVINKKLLSVLRIIINTHKSVTLCNLHNYDKYAGYNGIKIIEFKDFENIKNKINQWERNIKINKLKNKISGKLY